MVSYRRGDVLLCHCRLERVVCGAGGGGDDHHIQSLCLAMLLLLYA